MENKWRCLILMFQKRNVLHVKTKVEVEVVIKINRKEIKMIKIMN